MPRAKEPYRPGEPIVAELAAGAVVVRPGSSEPTVLLLHLVDEDRWCFPKGHVEPGESLVEAALREVREETGLPDVRLGDELCEVSYRFYRPKERRNVLKISVYFLARAGTSAPRTEPIFDRAEWVALSDAFDRVPYETDRDVLQAARSRLKGRD